jgi:hypothetical protein
MKTLAMLLSFVLTLVARVPAQTANEQLFPANPGATWVYRGTVSWYDMPSEKTVTKSVTFKTELLEVLRRQDVGVALFVFRGSPWAYDWTQGNAATEEWLIAESATHEMFLTDDRAEAAKKIQRFADQNDSLSDFFSRDDLSCNSPSKKERNPATTNRKPAPTICIAGSLPRNVPRIPMNCAVPDLRERPHFRFSFGLFPMTPNSKSFPGSALSATNTITTAVSPIPASPSWNFIVPSSRNPGRICNNDPAHQ